MGGENISTDHKAHNFSLGISIAKLEGQNFIID